MVRRVTRLMLLVVLMAATYTTKTLASGCESTQYGDWCWNDAEYAIAACDGSGNGGSYCQDSCMQWSGCYSGWYCDGPLVLNCDCNCWPE